MTKNVKLPCSSLVLQSSFLRFILKPWAILICSQVKDIFVWICIRLIALLDVCFCMNLYQIGSFTRCMSEYFLAINLIHFVAPSIYQLYII